MAVPSLLTTGPRVLRRRTTAELCIFCSQKRHMAVPKRAPTTRIKQNRQRAIVLTPEMEARRKELEAQKKKLDQDIDQEGQKIPPILTVELRMQLCQSTTAVAEAVTRDQAVFLYRWKRCGEQYKDFDFCLKFAGASVDDVYELTYLLRNRGTPQDQKIGRYLIRCCSLHGHGEATIQVVASMLRQDTARRGALQTREAMLAMDRLHTFSQRGNVRAMVLEANIARHYGQTDKAVHLYEQAVRRLAENDPSDSDDKYAKTPDELSSPWIELGFLQLKNGDKRKSLEAYMVGTAKDDPMAFFNLARLDFHMAGNQYNNMWLYNITKAAASGHHIAAYELGQYYANSSVPPASDKVSFMHHLRNFAAFLSKPNINLNPEVNIAHHNEFANTPELRVRLAMQWLQTAKKVHYLPANILLAQLHLQRFIYPSDNLKQLDPYGDDKGPGAVENPLFDPKEAHLALAEALVGCKQITEARNISKTNLEFRFRAQPWGDNAEVLETVEPQLDQVRRDAIQIADAAGIDVHASEEWRKAGYGLLYWHQGTRGEGLHELSKEDIKEEEDPEKVKSSSS